MIKGGMAMPIDFHHQNNRTSYTERKADQSWREIIEDIIKIKDKNIVDIGCGGGIYSKAMIDMGAAQVTGVDFSEEMLKGAADYCTGYDQIRFVKGTALDTKLLSEQYNVVLERALIHHIQELGLCFSEAYRLLQKGGTFIVQDRTIEDCLLKGSLSHIRGYIFSFFPKLVNKEVKRRHSDEAVRKALQKAGFKNIKAQKLWETRKTYTNLEELTQELLARTGRSILHDLTDQELQELVEYFGKRWQGNGDEIIIEQDRWTIWSAAT
jgi:ubiquinone/menaquinone biosynthesis C-methylase UbiE